MSIVHDRVQAVARDVFGDDELVLTPHTTARDVGGWDSLGHINFMYSIETEFQVTFSDPEFAQFANIGALVAVLETKLGEIDAPADPHGSTAGRKNRSE